MPSAKKNVLVLVEQLNISLHFQFQIIKRERERSGWLWKERDGQSNMSAHDLYLLFTCWRMVDIYISACKYIYISAWKLSTYFPDHPHSLDDGSPRGETISGHTFCTDSSSRIERIKSCSFASNYISELWKQTNSEDKWSGISTRREAL